MTLMWISAVSALSVEVNFLVDVLDEGAFVSRFFCGGGGMIGL